MLVANDPHDCVIMRNLAFLIAACLSLSLVAACSGRITIDAGGSGEATPV